MAKELSIPLEKPATKVYTYTRVSTAMQIDGYSLDAQRSRLKASPSMEKSTASPIRK